MGAVAGAGLEEPASGLRSGAPGATLGMAHALGVDWKPRAQRASAHQVHMRCRHKDGRCACMKRNGPRRQLPTCTSREGQNGNKWVSGSKC
eukprot:6212252-Pleurochrysis_carterae.AAC.2